MNIIKTSQPGWFLSLAKAYKEKEAVSLVDDGGVGIDRFAAGIRA